MFAGLFAKNALIAAALHLSPAHAGGLDGHGIVPPPDSADALDPVTGWSGATMPGGTWATGVLFEYTDQPLVRFVQTGPVEGGEPTITRDAVIRRALLANVGFAYAFSDRVGVGLTAPLYLHAGGDALPGGPAAGDLQLYVPIGLVKTDAFALSAVPSASVPTGAQERFLGDAGFGGSLTLAAGFRAGGFGATANVGARFRNAPDTAEGVGGGVGPTGTVHVGYALSEAFAPGVELSFGSGLGQKPTVDDPVRRYQLPAELLLVGRGRLGRDLGWTASVGRGVSGGVGASALRVYAGVTFRPAKPDAVVEPIEVAVVPEPDPPAVEVEPEAETPVDVRITVRDESGTPLLAQIDVLELDPDPAVARDAGVATFGLLPGTWNVQLTVDGYGRQVRELVVARGGRPQAVEAILLPQEDGADADLVLRVKDPVGAPVPGVVVRLDGHPAGTTGSGGGILLGGLMQGTHKLEVVADDFQALEDDAVVLSEGLNTRQIDLARLPGSVKVVARGPDGPVDAIVRFDGPSRLPPAPLGEDGERIFVVRPGVWTVLALSTAYGLQTRQVTVPEDETRLITVEFGLQPTEGGDADLAVTVLDPDGQPLNAVEVALDGRTFGLTSTGGQVNLRGLLPGERTLTLRGERYVETTEEVFLVPGLQERLSTVDWAPGTVRVVARTPRGFVSDATARFAGPAPAEPLPLGTFGEGWTNLAPGSWQTVVVSPKHGLAARTVAMPEAGGSLVTVEAVMDAVAAGDADLVVSVVDPEGRPVDGAQVTLDGVSVGRTTAGRFQIDDIVAGQRELQVEGAPYLPAKRRTNLVEGENTLTVPLSWAAGAVKIVTRRPDGAPVTDALVRLSGPAAVEPARVSRDGVRLVQLAAGEWQVLVVSPSLGFTSKTVSVAAKKPGLQIVEFVLEPVPEGQAALLVRARAPDGAPVVGAEVLVNGEPKGVTVTGGTLLVTELAPGPAAVVVRAPAFAEARVDALEIRAGSQERIIGLDWVPSDVRVVVKDLAGAPVDAEVALDGPVEARPVRTGEDGEAVVALRPGNWRVLASTKDLGVKSASIVVEPGEQGEVVELRLDKARVEVTTAAFVIKERVQFDLDRATLRPESDPILQEVANNLITHPGVIRVEIQGHTDATGSLGYNLELSQRRAEAVRQALVDRGVAPERLTARGYGATRPIASNDEEDGRAENRRVQFEIAEQGKAE